jgi:hypothetical protein
MNLIKVGHLVLNVDRINGIHDHLAVAGNPPEAGPRTVTRVLFDQGHIDLTGADAKSLRRWYRHIARDIAPHRDEEGEELISPEEQVHRVLEMVVSHIDRVRPRDPSLRSAAHELVGLVDRYITGELGPVRASHFVRHHGDAQADAPAFPEAPSA